MIALVLTGNGVDLSGGRKAHAQGAAASGEGEVKGEARTIEQVRTLVAELEAQAERQRSELRMTEATLVRARICWPNSKAAGEPPAEPRPTEHGSFA